MAGFSQFEQLLGRSGNDVGPSVLLLLAWIATSDGDLGEAEAKRLQAIAASSNLAHEAGFILQLAQRPDLEAVQLACEVVREYFKGENASRFVQLAVGVAVADGRLAPQENYILRLLADLLGVGGQGLADIFSQATGRPLPPPADPSREAFWKKVRDA